MGSRGARRVLVALALLAGVAGLLAVAPVLRAQPGPGEESPLKRKDIPPEGVDAVFSFSSAGGGDDACEFSAGAGPGANDAETPDCTVEIADRTPFLFEGFAADRELAVELTWADGRVEPRSARANDFGVFILEWASLPGDPLGVYSIVATQEALKATGTFTVRAATERQGVVVPRTGPPGTAYRIALAGFAPRETVAARLYRLVGRDAGQYVTSLGPTTMSERGEGIVELRSGPDDPAGEYYVVTDPPLDGASFTFPFFALDAGHRPLVGMAAASLEAGEALASVLVEAANRVWASVVAKDGGPLAELERVFGGEELAELRRDAEAMRAADRYRVARPARAPVVRGVRELSGTDYGAFEAFEAVIVEEWDDREYHGDGSPAGSHPGRLERRYVFAQLPTERGLRWSVVERDDDATRALALAVAQAAKAVWLSVVYPYDAPISDLEYVFGGQALAEVRRGVEALRAGGQYVLGGGTALPVILDVARISDDRLEARVQQAWDYTVYHADASPAGRYRKREEWRFAMAWGSSADAGSGSGDRFRIVEAELLGAE